jgi:hypothetical protein
MSGSSVKWLSDFTHSVTDATTVSREKNVSRIVLVY